MEGFHGKGGKVPQHQKLALRNKRAQQAQANSLLGDGGSSSGGAGGQEDLDGLASLFPAFERGLVADVHASCGGCFDATLQVGGGHAHASILMPRVDPKLSLPLAHPHALPGCIHHACVRASHHACLHIVL